ncbi:hypothetical protein HDU76_006651 [Blyttiomyces sp. JEL0837]|nr:hypothetical protein HDU76_006651 [Blyttiomyces sp. JEL0837]
MGGIIIDSNDIELSTPPATRAHTVGQIVHTTTEAGAGSDFDLVVGGHGVGGSTSAGVNVAGEHLPAYVPPASKS